MGKSKSSVIILFCFIISGTSLAQEVISIDLNGYGDANAYTGEAAVADANVWRAVYDGWGKAVGSARTANLADYDEPNKPAIYAAQIWIGIPSSVLYEYVSGSELLDDGFQKAIAAPEDPCIFIINEPADANLPAGAYQGTYDIYVYSDTAGSFTLKNAGSSETKVLSGGTGYEPNVTYVVFEDVVIDDGDDAVVGDGNNVAISFTTKISGLQLVRKKSPIELDNSATNIIPASAYDIARETNVRIGEMQPFGPDLGYDDYDPCNPYQPDYEGPALFYLDIAEYMIYDINCSENDAGSYIIKARIVPVGDNNASMTIYYYNDIVGEEVEVGTLTYDNPETIPSTGGSLQETDTIQFNIFKGSGYLKWGIGTDIYFNLVDLELTPVFHPLDCDDVIFYGYGYESDYNKDCRVDADDLGEISYHWVEDYSPSSYLSTIDSNCVKTLYLDGTYIDEATAENVLRFLTSYLKIGAEGSDTWSYNEYVRDMDEFAIYEGVLDADRVSAHYSAKDSNETHTFEVASDSPLLWLRFEDDTVDDGDTAQNSGSADMNGIYRGTGVVGISFLKGPGINPGSESLIFPDSQEGQEGFFVLVNGPEGELSTALDGDVTVELWAKFVNVNSGTDNTYPRFFSHNGSFMERGGYAALVHNDPCLIGLIGGNSQDFISVTAPVNDGQWHHYVFTYDSTYVPIEHIYPYEVKKDDPVLYIQFNDANVLDDSNNNYWTKISPLVEIHEQPPGAMGNAAWLGGGWIAAAPQTTEPALPTDFSHDYSFSDNEDLTVEFWVSTPQPDLVDDYTELFTDCNTLMTRDGNYSPYRPYAYKDGTCCRMSLGSDEEPIYPADTVCECWLPNVRWHHHVVIWDVNEEPVPGEPNFMTLHWYRDGTDQKNQTYNMDEYGWTLTNGPEMDHFLFGGWGSRDDFSPGPAAPYKQYVDELAIYDHVLSADRVQAHYEAWKPRNCAEIWEREIFPDLTPIKNKIQGKIDRNKDCNIDFYDFAEFALEWALCNDPQGGTGCVPNW